MLQELLGQSSKYILLKIILVYPLFGFALTTVKIGFLEPIDSTDSTSSIRFKKQFESAIFYAVGKNESQLNRCGYNLLIDTGFYEASLPLAGKREATRMLSSKTWMIYGPRRSEDLGIVNVALNGKIPLIGPMAELTDFVSSHELNFSMYADTSELADVAIGEILKHPRYKTFGTVTDVGCPACVKFTSDFVASAMKNGLTSVFILKVSKHETQALEQIQSKVDFVVVPNSSLLSSRIISTLFDRRVSKYFVGSNGWGDEYFGFLSTFVKGKSLSGFAIRVGLDYNRMKQIKQINSLDFQDGSSVIEPSFSSHTVIEYISRITKDLCKSKPKNFQELNNYYKSVNKKHFRFIPGYRTVILKNGVLSSGVNLLK